MVSVVASGRFGMLSDGIWRLYWKATRKEWTLFMNFDDWNKPISSPYIFLFLGVASILAAVIWTYTGRVWVRFNGWVYRAKEPRSFWGEVAAYYLVGVCFIGYFLYLVN